MLDKNKGLSFTFKEEPNFTLVLLTGDLNMFSAPELRTNLVKHFEKGTARFILDLTDLSFVDSSGIGVLVSFVSMAKKREGAKVVLCGLNAQIRNIFEVTRLLSVFNVSDDLESATKVISG